MKRDPIPGVFVLHFDREVQDLLADPATYGDARHCVGESASDVWKAVRRYEAIWAEPTSTSGPEFLHRAREQNVAFRLVHVRREDNPDGRRVARTAIRADPRKWCSICTGDGL